jgi:hypothetical protein
LGVEYFTERTTRSNQLYSVFKEPHCASVESFQLLPLSAQSYESILPPDCGGYITPYIPTAKAGGFTALFGKNRQDNRGESQSFCGVK